jgi:integrase
MYKVRNISSPHHVMDRAGIYYYVRRIPADLKQHYSVKRLCFSLRTKSHSQAMRTASSVHQRLEDYWLGLRLQQMDIPAIHLVKTDDMEDTSPQMMDAVEMYLSIKCKDDMTFIRTARRNGEYVSKVLGNRPITSYSSSEAAQFRDWCFGQGMNINTVKRVFASVRSIINLTMREHGIEGSNAFSGTFMPDRGDASTRQPIPTDKLRTIQQRCQTTDDEPRWLVALISDTGMRLSEAAGLSRDDIVLDADIPHVIIRPHPWRRLKTKGSERTLPLVGASLWAAKRAAEASQQSLYLFPRYCNDKGCKANSASAALNKWLKQTIGDGYVMHSFRHSMRDRLRAVNCPSEMIDQIGGWSKRSVGEGYGEGFKLRAVEERLFAIAIQSVKTSHPSKEVQC